MGALRVARQRPRAAQEVCAAQQRRDPIRRPGAEQDRQQRRQHQHDRIRVHDARRALVAEDHRQHRHAGGGVIVAVGDRQAPEVRRSPQEKHQREQRRQDADRRVDRRRPGQHRKAAREPAEDDIGPGAALEPDRVDHPVGEGAQKQEQRRHGVDKGPGRTDCDREHGDDHRHPVRPGAQRAAGEGTPARALHQAVAAGLDILVEGAGRGRCRQHRQRHQQHLPRRRHRTGCDRHPGQRRQRDQHADAQLEHAQHGAPARHRRSGAGPGRQHRAHGASRSERPRSAISSAPTAWRGTSS